jgi:hypothetical protein
MKKILLFGFLLSMLSITWAQNNDDVLKLKALNAKPINNFVTNDTASHSKIIHPRFVCITSDGKYLNRRDYLAAGHMVLMDLNIGITGMRTSSYLATLP